MTKKPEPAPTGLIPERAFAEILRATNSGSLADVIRRANHDYLYWDRFKYLTMPEGIRPEDAWRFVKVLRSISRNPTPVIDNHGHAFTYWATDEVQRCLHLIDRDAGGRITTSEAGIPEYAQQRYLVSSLMEEAIASSQIEGAATTRRVAKDMLRTGRRPRTVPSG